MIQSAYMLYAVQVVSLWSKACKLIKVMKAVGVSYVIDKRQYVAL
jgi:hypothetical protein